MKNFLILDRWARILLTFLTNVHTVNNYDELYKLVQENLEIYQLLQAVEIVHGLCRIVNASPAITFIQVALRCTTVFIFARFIEESRHSIGVPMFILAWSLAEMARYLYYATNIMSRTSAYITWCRYSFFIVCYPLGSLGEMLVISKSLPYVKEGRLRIPFVPQEITYYLLILLFIGGVVGGKYNQIKKINHIINYKLSFIGLPYLYIHMLKQRSKMLNSKKKSR